MPHEEVVREVPNSMRQQVLEEYRLKETDGDNYEIDYLITPGLGGADDIRNLWPEPLTAHEWSANVKDALEERLHQLVCTHQIDLGTAQREIATDWIAAYKKYFHTDRPLRPPSRLSARKDPAPVGVRASTLSDSLTPDAILSSGNHVEICWAGNRPVLNGSGIGGSTRRCFCRRPSPRTMSIDGDFIA
jgi:hypothetical protein